MSDTEPWYCGISELATRFAQHELSPVEVTRAVLDRIDRLDPTLHAYATLFPETALADAQRAEDEIGRGEVRGPLHGIPLGVKDLCFTKGEPTAAGMWIHRDFRPDYDATAVARLREAGAVLLGKLQLTDGAMVENHPNFPTSVNPWSARHWAGASSNGSAVATAAGLCTASLGSDTGGSIRLPCHMNGVTGIKPTWGRVSVHGVFGLAPGLDHLGPMARSAEDTAFVLQAIAGRDPADPMALQAPVPSYTEAEPSVRGLRIVLETGVWDALDSEIAAQMQAVAETFRSLGAQVDETPFPSTDVLALGWAGYCSAAALVEHESSFPARAQEYGPFLRDFLESGRSVTGMDIARIEAARYRFSGALAALFETVDLLLVPVSVESGLTPAKVVEVASTPEGIARFARFTVPYDFSGSPTITMPGGFGKDGLPLGFQLVAPHLQEARLVSAGRAYQQATEWHLRRPLP